MAEVPVYQEFLENILKALVNHPEDVKVERTVDEMGVLLTMLELLLEEKEVPFKRLELW